MKQINMRVLYCLLLMTIAQASVLKTSGEDSKKVAAPSILQVTASDGEVNVAWTPVTSADQSDPVLGYKVKVWEQQTKKVITFETIDGNSVLVEKEELNEFPIGNEIPDWKPREIVVGADKTSAKVDKVQLGITYEVRVQAYTKNEDGPLSAPTRILMGTKKTAE